METRLIPGEKYALSGFALKRIAIVSMIVDHFGGIIMDGVVAPFQSNGSIMFTADMPFMVYNSMLIRNICEALGSVAFPIFCFLMAEGFIHTHSPRKYALRVGIFALISEIPFDLAHYQKLWCFELQNVMFTLFTGIVTMMALRYIEGRFAENKRARWALTVLTVLIGMGVAFLLRGEYVFLGVLTIALLYILRDARWWRLLGFAPLLVVSPWILLALVPVLLYGGARGKGSKYFFYVFYPAHFLLFAGIAYLLAGRAV